MISKPLVSVIGFSCKTPGANSADEFWQLLRNGDSGIKPIGNDRWDAKSFHSENPKPAHIIARKAGFMDNVFAFEPEFFQISKVEAEAADPQQRLMLELAWQCLEHANILPSSTREAQIGVFVGASTQDYGIELQKDLNRIGPYTGIGGTQCIIANRISYFFDWKGPSVTCDTACSSSLTALWLAHNALLAGDCELALVGGVNLMLSPAAHIGYSSAEMVSREGESFSFDKRASGFGRGEAAGFVLLSRRDAALAKGQRIFADILGVQANQDGRSNGMSAPNGPAQVALYQRTLANAGIEAKDVTFVETHGTGTAIGDPIEFKSISEVYDKPSDFPLYLGAVKTNIGHAEAASGMIGLIKALMCIEHRTLPPNRNFQDINPFIRIKATSRVKLPSAVTPWNCDKRRIAAVSSMGFGGSNAHVLIGESVLELDRPDQANQSDEQAFGFMLFAHRKSRLRAQAGAVLKYLHGAGKKESIQDICFTSQTGRDRLAYCAAAFVSSKDELAARLLAFVESEPIDKGLAVQRWQSHPKAVVWLFTGQGCQYLGMASELYKNNSIFQSALDVCALILESHQFDLKAKLFGHDASDVNLSETDVQQPVIFAFEYALAQVWLHYGVQPAYLLGHSLGELVAHCIASVMSLKDALKLVVARGRLMTQLCSEVKGAMVSVFASEPQRQQLIADYRHLSVAGFNGADQLVFSGPETAIDQLILDLESQDISAKKLNVSHAFHSTLLEPMRESWREILHTVSYSRPQIPIVSNLTGELLQDAPDAAYFEEHVFQPVQFHKSLSCLEDLGQYCFLELGPQAILKKLAKKTLRQPDEHVFLPGLSAKASELQRLEQARGELAAMGAAIDTKSGKGGGKLVHFPVYQFDPDAFVSFHEQGETFFNAGSSYAAAQKLPKIQVVRSALFKPGQSVCEFHVEAANVELLSDHRILNRSLFPGAFYLDLLLAFLRVSGAHAEGGLQELQILRLSPIDSSLSTWQVVLEGNRGRVYRLVDDKWQHTAVFKIGPIEGPRVASRLLPSEWELSGQGLPFFESETIDLHAFYEKAATFGFNYGPAFRQLKKAQRNGDGSLTLTLGDGSASVLCFNSVDSALLDAAFQSSALFDDDLTKTDLFLPVSFKSASFTKPLVGTSLCQIERIAELSHDYQKSYHLSFFDKKGKPIGFIKEFTLRRTTQRDLYEAIFGKASDAILRVLERIEVPELVMRRAADYRMAHLSFLALPLKDSVQEILANSLSSKDIYSQIEDRRGTALVIWADASKGSGQAFLRFLQDLAPSSDLQTMPLVLLGLGADAKHDMDSMSAKVSMLRSFATENGLTLVRTIQVETDNFRSSIAWQSMLRSELLSLSSDLSLVSYRGGLRHVSYLERAETESPLPGKDYKIELEKPGSVDAIKAVALGEQDLRSNEVLIEVHSTGINFRDIAHILGLVLIDRRHGSEGKVPLGIECSGIVTKVGRAVDRIKVGMRVMAMGKHCAATRAIAVEHAVKPIPDSLSMEYAAALPVVSLTVIHAFFSSNYSLHGKSALITSATGGVGLTAIKYLQKFGVQIVALASQSKHPFLESLGVRHIFDSRSHDYVAKVRALNNGRGLDFVLNSMSDESIEANLSLLTSQGVFIEIGKRGVWTDEQVKAFRPDVEYRLFDLSTLVENQPELVQKLYETWETSFSSHELHIPIEIFAANRYQEAFDFVNRAKHMGKVVLQIKKEHQAATGSAATVAATGGFTPKDGNFLVVGSSGGLGKALGGHLRAQGARTLISASRTPPLGIDYDKHFACDVTDRVAVQSLASEIKRLGVRLQGIFFLSGQLKDKSFDQHAFEDFEAIASVKGLGLQNIADSFDLAAMDFVLCYSSIASLLFNSHQAAYSAANHLLNVQCSTLRAKGFPVFSVAWGPWDEKGMSESLSHRARESSKQSGMDFLDPGFAHYLMGTVLDMAPGSYLIGKFDWPSFVKRSYFGQQRAWQSFAREFKDLTVGSEVLAKLEGLDAPQRAMMITATLSALLKTKLGQAEIDETAALGELGADSLVLIDIGNSIRDRFAIDVPMSSISYDTKIADLAKTIHLALEINLSQSPQEGSRPALSPAVLAPKSTDVRKNRLERPKTESIETDPRSEGLWPTIIQGYTAALEKPWIRRSLRSWHRSRRHQHGTESLVLDATTFTFEFEKRGVAGNGIPIVFINGLNTENSFWERLTTLVSTSSHPIFLLNLPGFGQSQVKGSKDLVKFQLMSTELSQCLDAHFPAYHLVGWSMGGMIAQAVASKSNRGRKLVLLSSTARISPKALAYSTSSKLKDLMMFAEGKLANFFSISLTQSRENP
jgi:acyl transferase domain-containing protein/NADPH:quinone reductase-like Zn-dependent oxidoreductase/acyl carrier protein